MTPARLREIARTADRAAAAARDAGDFDGAAELCRAAVELRADADARAAAAERARAGRIRAGLASGLSPAVIADIHGVTIEAVRAIARAPAP